MDNFIVSARKYRPITFDSVVGQKSLTVTLKNAIKNEHLAHAYLFCGPRGVGKTTSARIFAKTINCQNLGTDIEPCNQCESCKAFNENRSYNIHELDAASNNSVEDIRTLIDQVRIPPQIGEKSVYIIDEVHMLSSQAFNAFLKTLEEPPKHAIFILATTEKHKILPTILSRCQIFDFNRITVEDITEHLAYVARKEGIEAQHDALNIIAQKADGAMRDALSYFDQIVSFSGSKITYKNVIENLNVLDYDFYFQLTDAFLKNEYSLSLIIFNEILTKGFDGHNFIVGLAGHFRDLLVSKDPKTTDLLEVGKSIKEKYLQQSKNTSLQFLLQALNIAADCDLNYKNSQNKRLHVELALFNMCQINNKPTMPTTQLPKADKTEEEKVEYQKKTEIKNNSTSTISIKSALSGKPTVKKQPEINNKQEEVHQEKEKRTNEFTSEDLIDAWNKAAEKIKQNKPRLHSILKMSKPVLGTNFEIRFSVGNDLQRDALIKEEKIVLSSLKEYLLNDEIKLNIEINKQEQTKKHLFTDTDKFKYLNEKNPNVAKIKTKLNLDF
jgi:DNA polymerase-3 subunit gamma/tau